LVVAAQLAAPRLVYKPVYGRLRLGPAEIRKGIDCRETVVIANMPDRHNVWSAL